MSLLDTASLIVTPNAYKEGKLYSVIPSDGSGDLSVTRATTATRVNSAGLVELVPYNLFSYSEQFENAYWSKVNTIITTNAITAPNGTLTADRIVSSGGVNSFLYKIISFTVGTTYTLSFYVKASSAQTIRLYGYGNSPDLDVTTEWTRISRTFTATSTSTDIGIRANSSDINFDIYIWGAQLVEGTNALPYQKTETRLNIPRLDYSLGSCPSILVEPQRTNLVPNPFAYTGSQVAFNTGVVDSPISGGLSTRITKNEAAGTLRYAIQTCSATALSSSTAYTLSAFFKYDGYNVQTSMEFNTPSQWGGTSWRQLIDVASTGVTLGTSSACTSTIENYGNGWYRVNVTITTGVTILGIPPVSYLIRVASSLSTGQGFLHTAAQLEAGAYATSYIPTTSASVTRNADVISKTGISSLIGQTEGTIFLNMNNLAINSDWLTLNPISGSPYTNGVGIGYFSNSVRLQIYSPSGTVIGTIASISGNNKIALGYKSGDTAMYINGVNVFSSSNAFSFNVLLDNITVASQSWLAGSIAANKIYSHSLYTTRLTNSELAQLTTP